MLGGRKGKKKLHSALHCYQDIDTSKNALIHKMNCIIIPEQSVSLYTHLFVHSKIYFICPVGVVLLGITSLLNFQKGAGEIPTGEAMFMNVYQCIHLELHTRYVNVYLDFIIT